MSFWLAWVGVPFLLCARGRENEEEGALFPAAVDFFLGASLQETWPGFQKLGTPLQADTGAQTGPPTPGVLSAPTALGESQH